MATQSVSVASRLYHGQTSFEFIRHRKRWYIGSGLVLLVSIISLAVRGLNPSIEFKGGTQFNLPAAQTSISAVRGELTNRGYTDATVQKTTSLKTGKPSYLITIPPIQQSAAVKLKSDLASRFHISPTDVSTNIVGSTWGSQITHKAVVSLIVFIVLVIIVLSVLFELKMAVAAIIALLHDLLITAGIYSLVGFEVSPSTVIALLTILGYSLYDTVVVFDKVRENTVGLAGGSRMTYSQAANLGVNQTLARSINTSIIALLPVAGLLIIGAGLLGAGSLKDLSLALLIGLASGAYSSIFIASPLLCDMKEREPTYQQLTRRVAARQGKERADAAASRGGPAAAATSPTPARAATAVLERDLDGDDPANEGAAHEAGDQTAHQRSTPRPSARPVSRQQQARQQQRRQGGRGGRGGRRGRSGRKRR